jgi:hypothetical protein
MRAEGESEKTHDDTTRYAVDVGFVKCVLVVPRILAYSSGCSHDTFNSEFI